MNRLVHNSFMAIGRPRQFDADKALSAATEQFWCSGYAATSLQDLLDAMHLSKSSLYQSFGNKTSLFVSCIDFYRKQLNKKLVENLTTAPSGLSFMRSLLISITAEAETVQRRGCLLVNTANELAIREPEIAMAVNRGFASIRVGLYRALERAKMQGELSEQTNIDELSDFLVSGISGLRTMVKLGVDQTKLNRIAEMLMDAVK